MALASFTVRLGLAFQGLIREPNIRLHIHRVSQIMLNRGSSLCATLYVLLGSRRSGNLTPRQPNFPSCSRTAIFEPTFFPFFKPFSPCSNYYHSIMESKYQPISYDDVPLVDEKAPLASPTERYIFVPNRFARYSQRPWFVWACHGILLSLSLTLFVSSLLLRAESLSNSGQRIPTYPYCKCNSSLQYFSFANIMQHRLSP